VIDFRYHLVSIIAVFLALAIGLAVGATSLGGATVAALQTAERVLTHTNEALSKDKQALIQQVNADQAFAQAGSGRLLSGLLTGRTVVLVIAQGADNKVVTGVTTSLRQAGATVTGQVTLNQAFLDTSGPTEGTLTQLAQRLETTARVTLPASSAGSPVAGQQAAATVLAAAILDKGTPLPAANSASVLNGFGPGGFLSISGPNGSTTVAPADLAVLVVPSGPPSPGVAGTNASLALVAVAHQLQAAGRGTVMAGGVGSIASGSPISAEDNAGQVTTVDNADTEIGQIIVAQALWRLLNGKAPGQYGVGPGAAPSPAPTPSQTPTSSANATPTPTASTGGHK